MLLSERLDTVIGKRHVYGLSMVAWPTLVFGATILAYSGQAEPYVSASRMPGGAATMFGSALGVSAAGLLAIGVLRHRSWTAMGRAVGLRPASGGIPLGSPPLEGSVEGRTVRVRTRDRQTGASGDDGSDSATFTVVEADLAAPAAEGLVLGRSGSSLLGDSPSEYEYLSTVELDEGVFAVGGTEDLARDVVSDRVREALAALGSVDGVLVGDAASVLTGATSGASDSALVGFAARSVGENLAGDASTVSYETKGHLLDAAELQRRVEAVVAVADAFEDATGMR